MEDIIRIKAERDALAAELEEVKRKYSALKKKHKKLRFKAYINEALSEAAISTMLEKQEDERCSKQHSF